MKNTFYFFFFLSFCTIFLMGCDTQNKTQKDVSEPPTANLEKLQILPPLPNEKIEALMNNTDYIDLIFINYTKTISQKEKLTVQNMVRQITSIPEPNIDCAMPFCKIIFYKMPEKLLEGDIHYGNGCAYFVFRDADGKPQYTNKLGSSGIGFFNDIITQFNAAAK